MSLGTYPRIPGSLYIPYSQGLYQCGFNEVSVGGDPAATPPPSPLNIRMLHPSPGNGDNVFVAPPGIGIKVPAQSFPNVPKLHFQGGGHSGAPLNSGAPLEQQPRR